MAPSKVEQLSRQVMRQISREITDLIQNPPEGIKVLLDEEDITTVQALIDGPSGTPYYGGLFRISLSLGNNFPASPPKGFFLTKIFHPNVGRNGEICVNTLKKDWKQEFGIKHILLTIKCLLIVPNPESALNEEAGKMFLEQYESYCSRAKMLTEIHAIKSRLPDFSDEHGHQSSSSSSVVTNNITSNNIINTGSNKIANCNKDTLFDKTTSAAGAPTNAASISVGSAPQNQSLDDYCGVEPFNKRLKSILDSYTYSTADQEQQSSQKSSNFSKTTTSGSSGVPSQQSSQRSNSRPAPTAMSSKNRGLKRVLRLRS